jgi:hypothetical protein
MKLPILLLITTTIATGCGDSITETGDRSVVMPLTVGNEWIGRLTRDGDRVDYDTVRIDRDTIVAGEHWGITSKNQIGIRQLPSRADEIHDGYLINRPDGLYSGGIDYYRRFSSDRRRVKFPVAIGDTAVDYGWYQFSFANGSQGEKYRVFGLVTALDQRVEVPAGTYEGFEVTFKCMNERGRDTAMLFGPSYDRAWFAPGVGLVKSVAAATDAHPAYLWELYEARVR